MAFDAFLKIDGIPGECSDHQHGDWIELLGFRHELLQPTSATASNAGGATSERVQHDDFKVSHYVDRASPKLLEACCTGKHIKEVIIDVCRAGGDKQKYIEIKLGQCIVSAVHVSGGRADFPQEDLMINYGKITWTYFQQKRQDGVTAGRISGGWDLTTNRVAA